MCVLPSPLSQFKGNSFGEFAFFFLPPGSKKHEMILASQTGVEASRLRQVWQAQTGSGSTAEAGSIVNTAVT